MLGLKTKPLNFNQTKKLAEILVIGIKKRLLKNKSALVFGFSGVLGAGKTTFIKIFGKELGVKEKIISPSFLIERKYQFSVKGESAFGRKVHKFNLVHLDCYRLKSPKELRMLDFPAEIKNPKNLVLIEWAEKIKQIMPKNSIWIRINIVKNKKRVFKFI